MRATTAVVAITILVGSGFSLSCSSNSSSGSNSASPPSATANSRVSPSPPKPSPPTPDQDARKQAEQYLESNFSRCSDSYYLLVRLQDVDGIFSGLYQLKGLSISMEPASLTEADRQNGIEWRGGVEYKVTTNRVYDRGVWGDWRNGGIFPYRPNPLVIGMNKKNGKWNIEGIKRQKADCASIPQ